MASAVERLRAADELVQLDLLMVSQAEAKDRNEFREALRVRVGTISRVEKPASRPDDILSLMQEL